MNNSENNPTMGHETKNRMKPFSVHMNKDLQRRYRAEKWFQRCGIAAIVIALSFLFVLFASIIGSGYTAFRQTFIELEVEFAEEFFKDENLAAADYPAIIKASMRSAFPEVKERRALKSLYMLISPGAPFSLQDMVMENPRLIGSRHKIWVPANDDVDMLIKGQMKASVAEENRRLKDDQLGWIDQLQKNGKIETRFNTTFFTSGDSREPELAGIWGAVKGSF